MTEPARHLRESFDATEDAAALSFVRRHPEFRYSHTWGCWLVWDGKRWKRDETVHVFDCIRRHCRCESDFSSQNAADQKRFCSPAFVAGVERFCKSDREYSTTADLFDADDWLLNTPAGIVELKTGDIRPHDLEAYCTCVTAVQPGEPSAVWREFLRVVTDGDIALETYLQRLAGYCLSGSVREHSLHFLYGTGANGKGTFLNALSAILNDYATTAPIEAFTETRSERHPTELAMLDGPRLVLAQETEQGRRWAETRIKTLTGGDPIAARRMRQDFYTYFPRFKLVIAGNHKPTLTTVDEAIRRRFHVVPFTVTIPEQERDKSLGQRLQTEWPGILSWAIEGAVDYWRRDGLDPPDRVLAATADYLQSQDILHEWLEDCCETGPDFWETPRRLFNSWRTWAKAANEPIGQQKDFKQRLEAMGFEQGRDRQIGRRWSGIKCRQSEFEGA